MSRWILSHPWLCATAAGAATFSLFCLYHLSFPGLFSAAIPEISLNVGPPANLFDAASEASADPAMSMWFRQWSSQSHSASPGDELRDGQELSSLQRQLQNPALSGAVLFHIAQILRADPNPRSRVLSGWFFIAYADHTISDLNRLNPNEASAALLELLWQSESFEKGGRYWEERERIYAALMEHESANSPQLFRARLKHADLLAINRKGDRALVELDSLSADLSRGLFPFAKFKDVAEVYWAAYWQTGRPADGLARLQTFYDDARGSGREGSLEVIQIHALAECGKVPEAKAKFAHWSAQYGSTSSTTIRDDLQMRLRAAEMAPPEIFDAHVRAFTIPSRIDAPH